MRTFGNQPLGRPLSCALLTCTSRFWKVRGDWCWSDSSSDALLRHYKWKTLLWLNSRDSQVLRPRSTRASPGPKSINTEGSPSVSTLHQLFTFLSCLLTSFSSYSYSSLCLTHTHLAINIRDPFHLELSQHVLELEKAQVNCVQ